MAAYLSQGWLDLHKDLARELPQRPGATARVQYVVSGAPEGEVRYHLSVEDGRITAAELGTDPSAEVTLAQAYDDARKVATGELDANAAFMQGRVKVTGNMGKLMSLMPLTQSAEYKAMVARVAERTEF